MACCPPAVTGHSNSASSIVLGSFEGERQDPRCALARHNRGSFLAVYLARVRLTVHADGATIIREGHGTGEGRGTSPGEAHDIALKATETDATKRALATFGKPFGLKLYRGGRATIAPKPLPSSTAAAVPPPAGARVGFHPDDTTPIPRPSRHYGRLRNELSEHFRGERRKIEPSTTPPLAPAATDPYPAPIDKSQLVIPELKRLRGKAHLKFVASQPCLVCAGSPPIRITCGSRKFIHIAVDAAPQATTRKDFSFTFRRASLEEPN